jgi:hypothetical protein
MPAQTLTVPALTGQLAANGQYVVTTTQPTSYQAWVTTGQGIRTPVTIPGQPHADGLRQQLEDEIAKLEAQVARLRELVEKIDEAAAQPAGGTAR